MTAGAAWLPLVILSILFHEVAGTSLLFSRACSALARATLTPCYS